MAPAVPTTPPARLSKTDSIRIIRTTRHAPPADRPQNADLAGPLEDRHDHGVQHADGADHQGHGGSDPGHGVDELDFGVELTNSAVGVASRFLPKLSIFWQIRSISALSSGCSMMTANPLTCPFGP